MSPLSDNRPSRTILCLIAGETALDRSPSALRYLQLGLLDEPIDSIMILPPHRRAADLVQGATRHITHDRSRWPMARWETRRVHAEVRGAVESLRHDGPIVVHAFDAESIPLAAQLVHATGGELVVSLSSIADLEHLHAQEGFVRASAMITPSQALAQAVGRHFASSTTPEVVHFGVSISSSPSAFRSADRSAALVYAGPLTSQSGCDTLLRAVRSVLQHHPGLLVFLIGKGPAESDLRHLADSLGIAANVTFTGRLDNWRTAVDGADIFCLPSAVTEVREEPVQALADGLAVVAADGSVHDCLRANETALLFPDGDEAGLAEALRRLLDDNAFARQLVGRARSYVRENYSVGRMATEYARIYQAVTARRRTIPIAGAV